MSRDFRIIVKEERFFPVQAFFNAIPVIFFVECMESLAKGVGSNINGADCSFPGDLDPGDESFSGVRFRIFEDEVVLTIEELLGFAQAACDSYLRYHPADRGKIELALKGLKDLELSPPEATP